MMQRMALLRTLVVLRPLELKQLFDFAIRLYRAAFWPMLLAMAMVQLPLSLVTLPLMLGYLRLLTEMQDMSNRGQLPDFNWFLNHSNELLIGVLLIFGAAVYQLLVMPLGRLTCARLASQALLGTPCSFEQALGFARSRYWQIQIALATYLLPLVLLALLLLLPVLAFTATGNEGGTIGAVIFALLGIMLGACATGLFYFRLFPALNGTLQAVEDPVGLGVFAQGVNYLKRAYALSQGYFLRLLGLLLLMSFAVGMVQNGINQSIQLVLYLIQAVSSNPNNFGQGLIHALEKGYDPLYTGVQMLLAILVSLVFPALMLSYEVLLYFDLRCRKEALDLHLVLDELSPQPTAPAQ